MHIDNYNDAIRIYNHALIRINSELVYVKNVRDDMDIIGVAIRSGKEVQVNINSEAWTGILSELVLSMGLVLLSILLVGRHAPILKGSLWRICKFVNWIPHHNGGQLIDEIQRMRYVGL